MPKKVLPNFTLRLPTLTTKKVWVGVYSEMTGTVVMLWHRKPKRGSDGEYGYPDTPTASIWIDEWEHWFGTVQPFVDAGIIEDRGNSIGWVSIPELDCTKVIQIELTASWNEHDQPIGLNMQADN
jgi:hypothetical protein